MSSSDPLFLQTRFRSTRKQLRQLDIAVAGLHPHTRIFLVHLIASLQVPIRRSTLDPTVPIPKQFVQEHCRKADITTLVEAGVVTRVQHNRDRKLCREYGLSQSWLDAFIEAGPTLSAALSDDFVDLSTGLDDRRKRARSRLSRNRRRSGRNPTLAQEAAKSILASQFNPLVIEEHLRGLNKDIELASTIEEVRKAKARYRADKACYGAVLDGALPIDASDAMSLWTYKPRYEVQRFGRLSEIGGGLQSCSRRMKKAAREGVPECHNYDLSASQPRFLVLLMEDAGIDPTWLREYLKDPKAKETWAARTGLSVDAWKTVLYALLMGGHAPAIGQIGFSEGSIVEAIREDVGDGALAKAFARFYTETAPLRDQLKRWHDYLIDVWAARTGKYVAPNKKTYVENKAGAKVALEDLSPGGKRHELAAKLAAFQLQGIEAAVMHRIAAAAPMHGFDVMSHEHDGLVTRGAIPDHVVKSAADAVGVPIGSVVLVEKPFV